MRTNRRTDRQTNADEYLTPVDYCRNLLSTVHVTPTAALIIYTRNSDVANRLHFGYVLHSSRRILHQKGRGVQTWGEWRKLRHGYFRGGRKNSV